MPHSDPKLDPRLDGPRICMKQVKEKCNEHGKDHVLGRRGLLHTTQMSIPASGGIETIESNSFELSANGDWLPTPNDGKRCILGCALMHSAVHPLSSTKKDASDDRSSSSMWNQNDDDHAEDGDEDNEGNDINGGETRSEFDVTDIVGILNFAVMEDKTLMPRLLYALATGHHDYVMYTDERGEAVYWGDPRINSTKLPSQVIATTWRGALLASYGASGFLMRATKPNEEVGIVPQFLSEMVEYGSPSTVRDTLCAFRITTSRKHVLREKAEAVVKLCGFGDDSRKTKSKYYERGQQEPKTW